jgi:O-antigen/teichoic acid export membrane protein
MSRRTRDKVIHGAMWAGGGKVISMPASIVSAMVLARAVSPSDYGAYFVAMSTVMILTGVCTLGMDQLVIRFGAMQASRDNRDGLRGVIRLCSGIVIVGALLVAATFALVGPRILGSLLAMPLLVPYAWLMALWVFFAALQRQLAETFRGLNDIRMATLAGGIRNLGILNTVIVCLAMLALWGIGGLTLFTALLCTLGASMIIVLLGGIVLWKRLRVVDGQGHGPVELPLTAASALHEGWPLAVAGLVVVINNTGTAWLASPLDTASHVALYGVAQRLVLLLIAPMTIINAVLPPIIAELHAADRLERLEHVVRSIAGLVLAVSLVLLGFLVVAGHPLLRLLFGVYYENAYPLMILLCAGQIANIATGAWQVVLPMTGNKHQMLGSTIIAVGTQITLGLALGYRMGVLGVAIGYCASVIITNIAGMLLARRQLGIWTCAKLNWNTMRDAVELIWGRLTRKLAWQGR